MEIEMCLVNSIRMEKPPKDRHVLRGVAELLRVLIPYGKKAILPRRSVCNLVLSSVYDLAGIVVSSEELCKKHNLDRFEVVIGAYDSPLLLQQIYHLQTAQSFPRLLRKIFASVPFEKIHCFLFIVSIGPSSTSDTIVCEAWASFTLTAWEDVVEWGEISIKDINKIKHHADFYSSETIVFEDLFPHLGTVVDALYQKIIYSY